MMREQGTNSGGDCVPSLHKNKKN